MAAGFRSPLPLLGVAATPTAGVRSPFAFWLGGAGAQTFVPTSGVRSPFAFWLGGAGTRASDTPPPPVIIGGGAARHPIRFPIPRKRREEEEELMILIAMALERMH